MNSNISLFINRSDKLFDQIIVATEKESVFPDFEEKARQRWKFSKDISNEILKIAAFTEIIKEDVKLGIITVERHKLIQEFAKVILDQEIKKRIYEESPAFFYQTMALLSEQFFRWGDSANAKMCVESEDEDFLDGGKILESLTEYNRSLNAVAPLIIRDSKITKEQIRFCLAYIQTSIHRSSDYENVSAELNTCKNFVENFKKKQENKDGWFGTLALIEGHFGRCFRNRVEYGMAVQSFGMSINYYEQRLAHQPKNNYRNTQERTSIQNKMALTLILGYGWMDIQRGQFSKAIYNSLYPARTLLAGMNDQLAKCYLDLLEVTAQRGLSLPAYFTPDKIKNNDKPLFDIEKVTKRALKIVNEFEKLGVPKFTLRAKYEYAMCLIFSKKWNSAGKLITEIFSDQSYAKDKFWQSKYVLLKARLAALLNHYENKQISLKQIIDDLDVIKPYINDYKQSQLEYYLAKGEAYLSWDDHQAAAKNFEMVRKLNRSSLTDEYKEPLNPRLEARSLLRLAEIEIRTGSAYKAGLKIKYWKEVLSEKVDDCYLHNLAKITENEIYKRKNREFYIKIDDTKKLNWGKQEENLKRFLIEQARLKAEEENLPIKTVYTFLGVSKSTYHNWLKELKIDPQNFSIDKQK